MPSFGHERTPNNNVIICYYVNDFLNLLLGKLVNSPRIMKAITRYEWKYQPQDFFEEPIDIRLPGLAVYSQNGTVTADVDAEATDNPGFSLGDLTETVINHFRGHQFLSRIPYTLENPTHIEFDESGNRHVFVHVDSGSYRLEGKQAHPNYSGSGERADRIDKKTRWPH